MTAHLSPWLVCPDCEGPLRVTHVAREGTKRVTKHSCARCTYKMISLSEIVVERPRYGQGFTSLRKKLRQIDLKTDLMEP